MIIKNYLGGLNRLSHALVACYPLKSIAVSVRFAFIRAIIENLNNLNHGLSLRCVLLRTVAVRVVYEGAAAIRNFSFDLI